MIIYAKTDDLTRYTDLADGTAQIAAVESANFPLVLANPSKFGVFRMPTNDMLFLGMAMNTQRYPTNITDFRQAVEHALNLTYINQEVFFGGLSPMVGPDTPRRVSITYLGNLPPVLVQCNTGTAVPERIWGERCDPACARVQGGQRVYLLH